MSALDAIRRIETARPVPGWGGATTRSAPLGESWQDEIRRVDPSGTGGEDGGSAFEQALARDQQNQEQQRGSGFGQRFSSGTLSTLIALQADPGFAARSYGSADVTSPSRAAARYEATANSTVLDDTAGAGDGGKGAKPSTAVAGKGKGGAVLPGAQSSSVRPGEGPLFRPEPLPRLTP